MKRFISFLLASIMLFSSVMSFAATGDFIHIELEKFYNMSDAADKADFIKDLKNKDVSKGGFYREVEGGKYVNVAREQDFQDKLLLEFLDKNNMDASDFDKFLEDPNNSSTIKDLQDSLNNLPEDFYEDREDIGDYEGNKTYAPKLDNPDNYSTPIPGSKEGMTQFEILKSYANSTKWVYKVGGNDFERPKSEVIVDGTTYVAGNDIPVKNGDFIILYATDLSNRVKAYDIIEIKEDMIGKARETAKDLGNIGTVASGNTVANAVSISGIDGSNWKYFIRSSKPASIFADDKFDDAVKFTNGEDILVADESTIIDDSFKRYVYLINIDGDKITEYVVKEIGKSNLSKLPERLVENTHYVGPEAGDVEGTTKFSKLDFGTGSNQWMYKIGDDVKVPIADTQLDDTFKTYTDDGIEATVGQRLFLAATDGREIKAYAVFVLGESNISGKKADDALTFTAEKGDKPGTTMVNDIEKLPTGATKFMYAIGKADADIFLDRVYKGSKNYTLGRDIQVEVGDTLYIFATDDSGRVKKYGKESLMDTMIKDSPAMLLSPGTHYRDIEKGSGVGETTIKVSSSDALNKILENPANLEWKYVISKGKFDIPESGMDISKIANIKDLDLDLDKWIIEVATKEEIKAEDNFARNLLLLATESTTEGNKVKGYAIIPLTRKDVKFPDAGGLTPIKNGEGNYSEPVKGSLPGTTKIATLKNDGLDNHSNWYYKVSEEELEIEYKETINTANGFKPYNANGNIQAKLNDFIVLVSTDGSRNTLAYKNIKLEKQDQITADSATELKPTSNYEGPVPGKDPASTQFTKFYGSSEDKWFYKKGDKSFGKIESGITIDTGYIPYTVNTDIKTVKQNDWILLIRTNKDSKVTGYANIQLKDPNIRGQNIAKLKQPSEPGDPNFKISPGNKPSTTKITDLNLGGIDGYPYYGWKWMYKVMDTDLTGGDIPYLNQKVAGASNYTSGTDINIVKSDSGYGYILLLATDSSGQAKAYAQIKVSEEDMVQKSAPPIDNAELATGNSVDSVRVIVIDIADDKEYRSLITETGPNPPAEGDSLPSGTNKYIPGTDISVRIGQFLTIYEVDGDNKITAFISKEITKELIKVGKAVLGGPTSEDNILLEGNIVNGGSKFNITLTDATWADDIKTNKTSRDKLFEGFKTNSDSAEWSKVVAAMIANGSGSIIVVDDNTITIRLPETPGYDIKEDQTISLTIPPSAIKGAVNPIDAKDSITIKPTVKATISGTVVSNIIRESDIKAGGATIVVELADGEWADLDDTNKVKLIKSFVPAEGQSGTNWDKVATVLKDNPNNIVINTGKKVTITLPPVPGVDFGSTMEIISLKITESSKLVENATEDIVASPNFTLYPNMVTVKGKAVKDSSDKDIPVILTAPDYKIVDTKNDTWTINVTSGTLKDNITDKDLLITGLPRNLKANVSKIAKVSDEKYDKIQIKLTGTASATLANDTIVNVKIKGSAVTDPNSVDSEEIGFHLVRGESRMGDLDKVKIDVVGGRLMDSSFTPMEQLNNKNIQFSLNSTNGTNGTDWEDATEDHTKDIAFKAGKVYVKDANNPRVFRLVDTLSHAKAPTGITVSDVEYDTNGKMKVFLGLDDYTKYEYSLDGGKDWPKTQDIPAGIPLEADSDLRVRLKATVDSLPSLATNKINILDLSQVKMNVGEGEILNTTSQMQYSLNGGETFSSAKGDKTTGLKFQDGSEIRIRDRSNPNNYRILGTVKTKTEPELTGIEFDISAGSITTPADANLQYTIDNDNWKDLGDGENKKIEFKSGQLKFRSKGDETHLSSNSATDDNFIIKGSASAPELKVDDYKKDISHWEVDKKAWTKLEDSNLLEYKIDDAVDWKDGNGKDSLGKNNWTTDKATDLIKNGNPRISVRVKASASTLASAIKVVNFTGNLTFEDVKINVLEGGIKGTTTTMQYSINSTDGKNGTWLDAKAGNTPLQFIKGMKIYIREKSKPLNFKELTNNGGITAEDNIKDDLANIPISYSIVDNSIENKLSRILEYRFNNEQTWNVIDRDETVYGIEFKAGKLEVRVRATEENLASNSIFRDIKAKTSAPSLLYNDVTYEIEGIGLTGNNNYEYNINAGTWIPGHVNTVFEGGNIVKIRLKAKEDTLASQEQTIEFTPNLDLNNVILNAGESRLENTSNLMEYSTNSKNGEDGTWTSITGTSTEIKLAGVTNVYIREKAKPRNNRPVTKSAIVKRGNISDDTLKALDYNILQGTISIENDVKHQETVNNLQYRINAGNWVNIDYVKLDGTADSKILAFNVSFTQGDLEFRQKGDMNNLASDTSLKGTIISPISAPNVSVGFDKDRNEVSGSDLDKLEYSLVGNDGPWIDGSHLDSENLVDNVYIRTKATKDTLPSSIKTLNFTSVLNLKAVNFSDHVKPHELNGVTDQIQYRINEADWKICDPDENGNSKLLKKDGTPLDSLDPVREIWIRDKSQHKNQRKIYTKKP